MAAEAGGTRLGTVIPLRTAKLTLTGGGKRVRKAGPPKEAGRSTEARRVSLSRFGGLNGGSANPALPRPSISVGGGNGVCRKYRNGGFNGL